MSNASHLVCAFIEPQVVGERFGMSDWPLHATVVPWFNLKSSDHEFVSVLSEAMANQQPFTARVNQQDYSRFGSRKVSLLEPGSWQEVHQNALEVIRRHAGTMATKVFIGTHYRPHVTFQKVGHLNEGDEFLCDSLYIVERQNKYRQVIDKVIFGNHETAA